jgi:TPR repeat protein
MDISINSFVSCINFTRYISYFNNVNSNLNILFETCEKHANAGHPQAMNNLGWLYKNGKGIGQDYIKAMEWFVKSHDKKNIYATNNIGRMYANGYGVQKSYSIATEYYMKAVEKQNPIAMRNMGDLYFNGTISDDHNSVNSNDKCRNFGAALDWYEKASNYGNSYAMYCIGNIYEKGGYGVEHNPNLAREWFIKSASLNNNDAINKLNESMINETEILVSI